VLQATTTRFDPDDQIHRSTHAWHHFAGNYPAGQTPSLVNCKPPSQSWPPRITVKKCYAPGRALRVARRAGERRFQDLKEAGFAAAIRTALSSNSCFVM